jgi:hypothetical protein
MGKRLRPTDFTGNWRAAVVTAAETATISFACDRNSLTNIDNSSSPWHSRHDRGLMLQSVGNDAKHSK